jgi:hypothetical protein
MTLLDTETTPIGEEYPSTSSQPTSEKAIYRQGREGQRTGHWLGQDLTAEAAFQQTLGRDQAVARHGRDQR